MIEDDTLALMAARGLDPLLWSSCRFGVGSAWHGHVSFAHWIVKAMQPKVVVELGTHMGVSFSAFCNAVRRCSLQTRCFAVDTWEGDAHAGFYDDHIYIDLKTFVQDNFASSATLMRCLFDDALENFGDGSVDLLHIDGLHTYEAVKHDFETWLPKLSERGVVLFHDTDVRERNFGVWKLWEELSARFPHFRFTHSAGLGVLAVGASVPPAVRSLCALEGSESGKLVRHYFAGLSDLAYRNGIYEQNKKNEESFSKFGRNIALNCAAFQSSSFEGQPATPQSAVNGIKTKPLGFHTALEENPWWMLDFGKVEAFDNILIYNRLDGSCAQRARTLRVLLSDDALNWTELYAHNGTSFGGVDGNPLHIQCEGSAARFVRIQLNERNYLHLVEVEIFARKET